MQPTLQLVSDRGATSVEGGSESRRTRLQRVRRGGRRRGRAFVGEMRALADDERGAVTAEYAIVIMATVGTVVPASRTATARPLASGATSLVAAPNANRQEACIHDRRDHARDEQNREIRRECPDDVR